MEPCTPDTNKFHERHEGILITDKNRQVLFYKLLLF